MPTVEYSAVVDAQAGRVWSVLKKFGEISKWHPAIPESVIEAGQPDGMVGCIRRLTLQDGAILRERLLAVDESNLNFSYRFEEAPLPLDNYVAMVKLIPLTGQDKTVIQWSANFETREPDPQGQYAAAVQELIVTGHMSLQRHLNEAKVG
ncbi:SRPBCC family protein [Cupriavidus sp. 8B]